MDRVSSSPTLSNCSQSKFTDDAHTSAMDSAVRNKRVALRIIDETSYAEDPLLWTYDSSQKYWEDSADSAKYINEFKRKTEREKTKELELSKSKSKAIPNLNSRKMSKSSFKFEDAKLITNLISGKGTDLISLPSSQHLNSKVTTYDTHSIVKSNVSSPYGILETDIEEGDYALASTSSYQKKYDEIRLPENLMPISDPNVAIPKLSIVPQSKSGTAWLKTSNLVETSGAQISLFEEDLKIKETFRKSIPIKDYKKSLEITDFNQAEQIGQNVTKENEPTTFDQKLDDKSLTSSNVDYSFDERQIQSYEPESEQSVSLINSVPFQDVTFPAKSNNKNCSRNINLKFPSRNGGYWIPHFKPLSDFMDFKFEEKVITFSDEEIEIIKRFDYILAYKFCYRGFNIIMMNLMFLCILLLIIVPTLYVLASLPKSFELIHLMFFILVIMFILFVINSCASKEVRIDGRYLVRSYVKIYWHLFRRKFDRNFNISYMFLDDWYGDDKYKFLKAKLNEIQEIEEMINHDTKNEM